MPTDREQSEHQSSLNPANRQPVAPTGVPQVSRSRTTQSTRLGPNPPSPPRARPPFLSALVLVRLRVGSGFPSRRPLCRRIPFCASRPPRPAHFGHRACPPPPSCHRRCPLNRVCAFGRCQHASVTHPQRPLDLTCPLSEPAAALAKYGLGGYGAPEPVSSATVPPGRHAGSLENFKQNCSRF